MIQVEVEVDWKYTLLLQFKVNYEQITYVYYIKFINYLCINANEKQHQSKHLIFCIVNNENTVMKCGRDTICLL